MSLSGGRRHLERIFLTIFFFPGRGRAALLLLEHPVEIGARREATFRRDDVVAVVGMLQYHLLGRLEAHLGQPDTEGGVVAGGEVS